MKDLSYLDKNKYYLVAISGGPDSMSLVHQLLLCGFKKLVVCHVNYHKRQESNYEEEKVKEFALNNNLLFEVLDTTSLEVKGNFQSWARNIRYNFFLDMSLKYKTNVIFVGHNQDDLLETYLMQRRKGYVSYYGLNEESWFKYLKIIRPLLDTTKRDLLEYCIKNNVFYSIDSSNLTPTYTRNKIRIDIVSKMNKEERLKLLDEIDSKNKLNERIRKITYSFKDKAVDCITFAQLDEIEKITFLYQYFSLNCSYKRNLSLSFIGECIHLIESKYKEHSYIDINDDCILVVKDNKFWVEFLDKRSEYKFIIDKPQVVDNEIIHIDLSKDLSLLKINDDSFPLTIEPVDKNEYVTFNDVKKKVNRVFIDSKIPSYKRYNYPVIKDRFNKIVYFPLRTTKRQNFIADYLSLVLK